MKNAYAEAERFKEEAESEKGVMSGNVARLLFWPATLHEPSSKVRGSSAAVTEAVSQSDLDTC